VGVTLRTSSAQVTEVKGLWLGRPGAAWLLSGLLGLGAVAVAPAQAQAQAQAGSDVCLSDPKCAELCTAAANLSKADQTEAALALYQTAYTQRPAAWLLVNIGRLQQKLGRLSAAINSYRQYLASLDTTVDPELTRRAQEYLAQAQSQVSDVCLSDTKCAELNETARSLSKAGQLDAALRLYQTAYAMRPALWLLVNIGRMQQKLERLPEAIASYKLYLSNPDAKDDPELTKKAQEYLFQAEADFEPEPAALVAPPPPPPPPPPPADDDEPAPGAKVDKQLKQKRSGFAVALGFGSRRPVVQVDGNTTAQSSSVGGTLFFGYKINRVIAGLGLEIDYFGSSTQLVSAAGSATTTVNTTSFLLTPGLQVAVLRAAAGRFELLASAQLGLGRAITNRSLEPAVPPNLSTDYPNSNFHLSYQLGPGLRYFVLRQFAVTLVSGVAGDHFFATQDSPSGLRADTLASVSIFGSLGMLGVF